MVVPHHGSLGQTLSAPMAAWYQGRRSVRSSALVACNALSFYGADGRPCHSRFAVLYGFPFPAGGGAVVSSPPPPLPRAAPGVPPSRSSEWGWGVSSFEGAPSSLLPFPLPPLLLLPPAPPPPGRCPRSTLVLLGLGWFGVGLGSVWVWFGVGLGSFWRRCGVGLGSVSVRFGSVWRRFGFGLGSGWGRFGVVVLRFGVDHGPERLTRASPTSWKGCVL